MDHEVPKDWSYGAFLCRRLPPQFQWDHFGIRRATLIWPRVCWRTNMDKQFQKSKQKALQTCCLAVIWCILNDQKEWLGECHQSTLVERGHFQVLEQLLQNMPQNFSWHSVASAMACVVCLCGYANASASGLALLYLLVAMTICSSFQISAHLSQKRRTWLKITLARSLLGEMEG